MKQSGRACFAVLALLAAGGAEAQSAGQWRDADQMYDTVCAYCHDTGVGPVLKGSQVAPDKIKTAVRHGAGPMPAFKPSEFSDTDLDRLAAMLSTAPAQEAKP